MIHFAPRAPMPTYDDPPRKKPRKDQALYVYVTPAQKALIDRAAKTLGLKVSDFIRQVVLREAKRMEGDEE